MVFKDLTNNTFGKLIAKEKTRKGKKIYWKCSCECGNLKEVASCHLISGSISSCGCEKKLKLSIANTVHGKSKSRLYRTFNHMKGRCYRKNDSHYKNYGGRGITICNTWLENFVNFYNWAIENGYEEHLTIERIDVNGNYEPANCKWIKSIEQASNTTRSNFIYYKEEKYTISQISRKFNIKRKTLYRRLELGWELEKALTKPVGRRNKK